MLGTGRRTARRFAIAAAAGALGLAGCGGGSGGSTASGDAGAAAVSARSIPAGVTITHTETGAARSPGEGMTPLRTAAAAKAECASLHAGYIAKIYGGISDDFDSVAYWFARHRAAPGDTAIVRRGCRSGLHV
jgi:hypothetical protein